MPDECVRRVCVLSSAVQVQCVFAYLFSVWLLKEKVSCLRVLSVALCVCGTGVILLAAVGIRINNAADDDTTGCTCCRATPEAGMAAQHGPQAELQPEPVSASRACPGRLCAP